MANATVWLTNEMGSIPISAVVVESFYFSLAALIAQVFMPKITELSVRAPLQSNFQYFSFRISQSVSISQHQSINHPVRGSERRGRRLCWLDLYG
jgi:hypothetical protein